MDNTVYILHPSVIVQNGLAEILSKRFKCRVKMFSSYRDFQDANEIVTKTPIFLVEDDIATSNDYLYYSSKVSHIKSYSIVCFQLNENDPPSENTISLYDTPDEIYKKVKIAFNQSNASDTEHQELSNREIEVLRLVALGYSNKEIADKLYISSHTVMSHRKNMTVKLGIKSISGLTVYAIINDYIDTTDINVNDLI